VDRNTELLLLKAARTRQWEDEERASYDLETMTREFHERLYGPGAEAPAASPPDKTPAKES
jgi:hypothetical protein